MQIRVEQVEWRRYLIGSTSLRSLVSRYSSWYHWQRELTRHIFRQSFTWTPACWRLLTCLAACRQSREQSSCWNNSHLTVRCETGWLELELELEPHLPTTVTRFLASTLDFATRAWFRAPLASLASNTACTGS